MSVAVSSVVATEAVPGDRAGTETAAPQVPAKFLVRVLASLLTEQAKDGFDSDRWLQVRSHYCRLLCRSPRKVRVRFMVRVRG